MSIEGFVRSATASTFRHSRIEPQIVVILAENNRHAVMDLRRDSVRCGRQDRARLDPLAARVFPSIPQSRNYGLGTEAVTLTVSVAPARQPND